MTALDQAGVRRLVVLSHPNHEAAIFGIVQRLRPRLVVLTDGGGEPRPSESRQALECVGLLDHATFLDFRESDFYSALLDCDLAYFQTVIGRLRSALEEFTPEQIVCDAVEFYNPVHDLSLPIVRAALRATPETQVFEAPLIYQKAGNPESYELQRFPPSRRAGQIEFHLSEAELAEKLGARDRIYGSLRAQLEPLLERTPADHFATEIIGPAATALIEPHSDQTLRYDWRARMLLARGAVTRAITRAEHYVPLAAAMFEQARAAATGSQSGGRSAK
jgi:hypothetical protein